VAREIVGAVGRNVSAAVASVDLEALGESLGRGGAEAREALTDTGRKARSAVKKLLQKNE
jgi:hypothetical protein